MKRPVFLSQWDVTLKNMNVMSLYDCTWM